MEPAKTSPQRHEDTKKSAWETRPWCLGVFVVRFSRSPEAGFALPSILMLLTILSLVAASVLLIQYMQRRMVQRDAAMVKAEYAAQSGVAEVLAKMKDVESLTEALKGSRQHFAYDDGSQADVETSAWGIFLLVRSTGSFGKASTTKVALSGMHPPPAYDNALILGNVSHQLVLTGSSFITGDVLIGTPGLTTGSLRDYATPISLPHKGKVITKRTPDLPPIERSLLQEFSDSMADILRGRAPGATSLASFPGGTRLRSGMIADTTDIVLIQGNVLVDGTLLRGNHPLYISAWGKVEISPDARIEGLVLIAGMGEIVVESGAASRHVLLYSEKEIRLRPRTDFSGQLIAPVITCDSGSVARYPSCVVSLARSLGPDSSRSILVSNGAHVEGTICLFATAALPGQEDIVRIEPSASVVGSIYSSGKTTLDGSVTGTVVTDDFFFYAAPTSYIGWLRSARIDRSALPPNFLMPPAMTDFRHADVLEWM